MIKDKLLKLSLEEIESFIKSNGSVILSPKDNKTLVEHILLIENHEFCSLCAWYDVPKIKFENIENKFFYLSYTLDQFNNLPYKLNYKKSTLDEEKQWEESEYDKFSKNNYKFLEHLDDENDVSYRSYLKPVAKI